MRPESLRWLLLCAACVLAACSTSPRPPGQDTGLTPTGEVGATSGVDAGTAVEADAGTAVEADAGTPDAGPAPSGGVAPSSRNHLRFKSPEQLTAHFAAALSLPPEQVCNELGQYPCTTSVHTVALGGVDPYGVGFYEPVSATGVTAPVIVDRVALAACGQRVLLDVTTPEAAVIFGGIELDAQGHLAHPEGAPVKNAIIALYQRALLRDPTDAEVERVSRLATEIEATGSQTPGRDWMHAACFAVLSSAESIFF